MTSRPIHTPSTYGDDTLLWRSIFVDLSFWSVAGGISAAFAGPLGELLGIPQGWLATGGILFLVGGAGLLVALNRTRPVSRGLVQTFALFNLIAAPLAWLAALLGWLPLSTTGNWGLAIAGDIMLMLGIYQVYASRRHGRG